MNLTKKRPATSADDGTAARPGEVRPGGRLAAGVPRWLERLWQDRRLGAAVTVGIVAVATLVAAWTMPRGPVATLGAVAMLLGALGVGLVAGLVMRSRWSLLAAPLTFVVVYELWWLGVDGPMTDVPRFDSIIGIMVVALGRGWLAVLALLPMMLGAVYGQALARRIAPDPDDSRRRVGGRVAAGLATLAVVALLAGLVRPTGTPAIVDDAGEPIAGSIAELTTVELGGHDQAVLLRGHDVTDPVLLYLAGGPGGSDLGASRLFFDELEEDFVVAAWDQRGTGKSYAALEPRETHTLDRAVADLVELTDHLRDRFGQDQIYLVGNSWGSTIAVLAAQQHPDRYTALVGTGQMVSQRATDVLMFEQMLADARADGDAARAEELETLGPPPYDDVADYAPLLVADSPDPSTEWPANSLVREYSLVEQVNIMPALVETFATLYPQLQDVDFRRDVSSLDVPVWVVDGADEDPARSDLSAEWLDGLDAPITEHVVIDDAAHRPHFQQPEAFAEVMRTVLERTTS